MNPILIAATILLFTASSVFAQHGHKHHQPDATNNKSAHHGQESRPIKSLSDDDVRQLLDGAGWGFARPAELSGYPGPRHVLDLADELKLTTEQRSEIEAIFQNMNAKARSLGQAFIEAERAISDAFARTEVTSEQLTKLVENAARLRAALRLVHLEAHLVVRPVLTPQQITSYNTLRGYNHNGAAPEHDQHHGRGRH